MHIGSGLDEVVEATDLLLAPRRAQVTQEIESLEAFAFAIVAMEVAWREQRVKALKTVGKLVATDAKNQIGEYQSAVGNYPAWADLAESTEEEKARLGAPANAPLLRFGDLKDSFTSEVEGVEAVVIGSTDPVMEYHEFGTSKMPPRPVLGPALYKNIEKIQEILGIAVVDAIVVGQRMGYRFNAEDGGISIPKE